MNIADHLEDVRKNLEFQIKELRRKRKILTDSVDNIDTEIIGLKLKLEKMVIKNEK